MPSFEDPFEHASLADMAFIDWITAVTIVAVALFFAGYKQRVEGNGRWWIFIGVVAALSLLGTLPMAVRAMLIAFVGPCASLLPPALVTTFLSCLAALRLVRPIRIVGVRKELPEIGDAAIVARITSLAQSMGLPPPPTRLVKGAGEQYSLFAGVAGIHAPSIVVFQGIVNRLDREEQDAIFAHELAHLANRSFWFFVMPFPVAGVLTLSIVAWMPNLPAIPFALCLGFGLNYIVHRWFELDCDRRGALATSFRGMQSALAKLHADFGRGSQSWITSLAYATVTHPHRDVRMASLYREAPEQERALLAPPTSSVTRHHRLSTCALFVWIGVLIYAVLATLRSDRLSQISGPLLLATAFAPSFLLLLSHNRHISWSRQRQGQKLLTWRRIASLVGVFAVLSVVMPLLALLLVDRGYDNAVSPIVFGLAVGTALAFVIVYQRGQKLRSKMMFCLVAHKFDELLALTDQYPHQLAKCPDLRNLAAIVHAVQGNRTRAIEQLRELIRDKPRFSAARLSLGSILADEGQAEAALEQATEAVRLLPRDPLPWIEVAWIERRVGRLDAAEKAAKRALELDATSGLAEAVLAAIALDRRDTQLAQELLKRAMEHAPGMCLVRVVAAQIAMATQSFEAARRLVEEAIQSIDSEPFAFMQTERHQLQSWLGVQSSQSIDAQG